MNTLTILNSMSFFEITTGVVNIIIAILTLILAFYVFIYQKNKDNKNEIEVQKQNEKNIKLWWFKEIIIQPRMQSVFVFYESISDIRNKINSSELTTDEKIEIISYVKEQQSLFRKSFLDLIQCINIELYNKLKNNIDKLTDQLTDSISNDELKLNREKTYNQEIYSHIQLSYNDFLSEIFNYCG